MRRESLSKHKPLCDQFVQVLPDSVPSALLHSSCVEKTFYSGRGGWVSVLTFPQNVQDIPPEFLSHRWSAPFHGRPPSFPFRTAAKSAANRRMILFTFLTMMSSGYYTAGFV